jgi:hypothetical protein
MGINILDVRWFDVADKALDDTGEDVDYFTHSHVDESMSLHMNEA